MTDRRRAQGQAAQEENPYAPPPEDRPDQPWQPRQPEQGHGDQGDGPDQGGTGQGERDGEPSARTKWGSQWSSRQPGRTSGGFGSRGQNGDEGGRGSDRNGGRLRWDPKDPAQRHARYSLIASMWSVFFALFNIPPVALLLGALALYWGISALRGAPGVRARQSGEGGRTANELPDRDTTGTDGPTPGRRSGRRRPQFTAAIVGVVVGSIGLLFVMSTFTVRLVYKDYYDCVDNSLTTPARQACDDHLPERLRSILGEG